MSRPFSNNFSSAKQAFGLYNYHPYKKNKFNLTQLYSSLYTKLDFRENTPIISDLSGNAFPIAISTTTTPYLTYNIDVSGNLFGDTVCGLYNYRNYIAYNKGCFK